MRKYILASGLFIIGSIFFVLYYLSVYGIKTNKFNDLINEKFKKIESKASLKINDVFFKLNLKDKSISINTKDGIIFIDKDYVNLSDININIDLFKFINNDNSIKNIEITTKENKIRNVSNFLNSYKFNLPLFVIYNQIKSGNIKISAKLYFNTEKEKSFNYEINGEIFDANLNIFNKTKINNINFNFNLKDQLIILQDIKLLYEQIELKSKKIKISKKKENYIVSGNFKNKKNLIKPNFISRIANLELDFLEEKKILIETDNDFSFKVNDKRKIKDLNFKSKIQFDEIFFNKKYSNLIFLKNGNIVTNYSKENFDIKIDSKYLFLNEKLNKNIKGNDDIIINISKKINENINIKTFFKNKKNSINIKDLYQLIKFNKKFFKDQDLTFESDNAISFDIGKNKKIKNLKVKSKINLDEILINLNSTKPKKFILDYKKEIILKNNYLEIDYTEDKSKIQIEGDYSFNNNFDKFKLNLLKSSDNTKFDSTIEVLHNSIIIDEINYKKEKNISSLINLKGDYKNNKEINFSNIKFVEGKNKIYVNNLDLSKKFKINYVDKLELNYFNNNKKKNHISLIRDKNKYELISNVFDGKKSVNSLISGSSKKNILYIFDNLNSEIDLSLNQFFVDDVSYLKNIKGKLFIENNKIKSGKINALLNEENNFSLNIKTNSKNEKITNLFIDEPEPFIKSYKFIKGFKEGSLSYDSIEKNNSSSSILKIYDFKIKEVPVLAKILTLASLQGIADLLTGEGIRFDEFEMVYDTKESITTINEMYAIGPAMSMLMEGYVEKEKITSLRGTLVPATTINKTIAKIPLIGNILVGKKVGEGVFGVSFKIKGPPKKLKTTVNPVKTLTPRFITRTLDKLKKN